MSNWRSDKAEGAEQVSLIHSDYKTVAVELQFELLKQFAWLGSAVIGGIVVMLQLDQIELGAQVYLALACFAASIIVSVQGQDYLVNKLTDGRTLEDIASNMKTIRFSAFGLIFFGLGIMISHFLPF